VTHSHKVQPESKKRGWRIITIIAVVVAILALLPLLADLLSVAIGVSFLTIEIVGLFIFLVGMPLFFWIMSEAGYRVFLRPYMRARRIRIIRNRRLMFEAAARSDDRAR
jgi:uncharacterized membrane protein